MVIGTRQRILEALKAVLVERGATGATLEAVAAEAGVSKGGLLYHFPSKEALFSGLIASLAEDCAAALAAAGDDGAAVARVYIEASSPQAPEERALHWSILAALRASDPSDEAASAGLRTMFDGWAAPLRATIGDPVLAETIRLVGDGIFLNALLGIPPAPPEVHEQVLARLLAQLSPG